MLVAFHVVRRCADSGSLIRVIAHSATHRRACSRRAIVSAAPRCTVSSGSAATAGALTTCSLGINSAGQTQHDCGNHKLLSCVHASPPKDEFVRATEFAAASMHTPQSPCRCKQILPWQTASQTCLSTILITRFIDDGSVTVSRCHVRYGHTSIAPSPFGDSRTSRVVVETARLISVLSFRTIDAAFGLSSISMTLYLLLPTRSQFECSNDSAGRYLPSIVGVAAPSSSLSADMGASRSAGLWIDRWTLAELYYFPSSRSSSSRSVNSASGNASSRARGI